MIEHPGIYPVIAPPPSLASVAGVSHFDSSGLIDRIAAVSSAMSWSVVRNVALTNGTASRQLNRQG